MDLSNYENYDDYWNDNVNWNDNVADVNLNDNVADVNLNDLFANDFNWGAVVNNDTVGNTVGNKKSPKKKTGNKNKQDDHVDSLADALEIGQSQPAPMSASIPAPMSASISAPMSASIPAPVQRLSQSQFQPASNEKSFNDFFNKIGKYLKNEPVKFNGVMEERTKFIILQTLERIKNENEIKSIQSKEFFQQELEQHEKELLEEWNKSNSILIMDTYTHSENTKLVSNNTELEKNKYAEGYQKRLKLQITKDTTKMSEKKFDEIFKKTKKEVFPVYNMLRSKKYEKNRTFLDNVRNNISDLRSKSDSYLYKIFDDYEERKAEIGDNKIELFQINTNGKEYLYFNQIQRFNYFDKDKAKKVRNQSFNLDKSGTTYKNKVKDIVSNIKAFLNGGDDMIMKKWYEERNQIDKYESIKNDWQAFIRNIRFKIKTYSIEINGSIYEYERDYDEEDDVCKTVDPVVEFNNLFSFLRDFNEIREDVKNARNKISEIFRKDIDNFKNELMENGQNLIFTRQISRYEIMLMDEISAKNGLRGLDKDQIDSIISQLEFVGKPKKAVRSRSLRPMKKKEEERETGEERETEDATEDATEDGVTNIMVKKVKNANKIIKSTRKNRKK